MNTWIKVPVTLEGKTVRLLPLEKAHFTTLAELAKEKSIWEFYPFDCSDTGKFFQEFDNALLEREKGNQYPFIIFHKPLQKIIGSTRFLDMHPEHKKLEIGWTWLHPDYWKTAVNVECKLLLLNYCFETLKTIRVQLKTDENNIRSRKAIEKIGGRFEGVLRNERIRDDGTYRNSVFYSITDEEWPEKKQKLMALYSSW